MLFPQQHRGDGIVIRRPSPSYCRPDMAAPHAMVHSGCLCLSLHFGDFFLIVGFRYDSFVSTGLFKSFRCAQYIHYGRGRACSLQTTSVCGWSCEVGPAKVGSVGLPRYLAMLYLGKPSTGEAGSRRRRTYRNAYFLETFLEFGRTLGSSSLWLRDGHSVPCHGGCRCVFEPHRGWVYEVGSTATALIGRTGS